jgi:5-methylcytosine-specific restriction protein A
MNTANTAKYCQWQRPIQYCQLPSLGSGSVAVIDPWQHAGGVEPGTHDTGLCAHCPKSSVCSGANWSPRGGRGSRRAGRSSPVPMTQACAHRRVIRGLFPAGFRRPQKRERNQMGLKPCLEAGCGRLTERSRCPDHERATQRARDVVRGTAAERGYDSRWARRVKEMKLAEPWCHRPGCPHRDAGSRVNPLTGQHVVAVVNGGSDGPITIWCRRCNSAEGASLRRPKPALNQPEAKPESR